MNIPVQIMGQIGVINKLKVHRKALSPKIKIKSNNNYTILNLPLLNKTNSSSSFFYFYLYTSMNALHCNISPSRCNLVAQLRHWKLFYSTATNCSCFLELAFEESKCGNTKNKAFLLLWSGKRNVERTLLCDIIKRTKL